MKRRRPWQAEYIGLPRTVPGLIHAEDLSLLTLPGRRRMKPVRESATSRVPHLIH